MKLEEFQAIMEEDNTIYYKGDNAYEGLKILSKYTDNLVQGADHNIIYSEDVDVLLERGITEDDVRKLRSFNWMIHDEYLACFV